MPLLECFAILRHHVIYPEVPSWWNFAHIALVLGGVEVMREVTFQSVYPIGFWQGCQGLRKEVVAINETNVKSFEMHVSYPGTLPYESWRCETFIQAVLHLKSYPAPL